MTNYLISFPASAMDVPDENMAAVAEAARAVIREAKDAGVYVFGGGINGDVAPLMVAAAGSPRRWRHRVRHGARQDVARTAGRERHDEPYRLGRILLRRHRARERRADRDDAAADRSVAGHVPRPHSPQ